MILKANAKVNLHLDIGPRRSDGYHTLKTIFQEISLHDTLSLSLTKGPIRLSITPRGLPTNSDNLIVRALEMLRKELGVREGINVRLIKRIPMGAGLGGGSSDAAAALWGGWLIWTGKKKKPEILPTVLRKLAPKLGADVAFFLKGGLAKATGIGEKLTSLKRAPKRWLVLIYPKVHVSTPIAYKLLDESRASSPRESSIQGPIFRSKMDPGVKHARMTNFNSFEPVILAKFPPIAKAKQALADLGCTGVMMSGSGSTVFGFVRGMRDGQRVLRALKNRPWSSFLVHTVF